MVIFVIKRFVNGGLSMSDCIRLMLEAREHSYLTPLAAKSSESVRASSDEQCPFRTAFQRDRDRILHSKAFRRLKHKTQVYIAPGDHYRTRLTHSLEVAQIARTIARALLLNEDLTEAIALGHDVGHTPFGHSGEQVLRELIGRFFHNEQSLRVVEHIEKDGKGLNLTTAVLDGIIHHTGNGMPTTLEGNIVRISDRIAYLCHDYDDGIRAKLLSPLSLPHFVQSVLGCNHSQMITTMVADVITQSTGNTQISRSSHVIQAMAEFRQFMFEKVYSAPQLEPDREQAHFILTKLYHYFMKNPYVLPKDYQQRLQQWGLQVTVIDYIAGLTDQYALHLCAELD